MSPANTFVIRPAYPHEMLHVGALVARVFSRDVPARYATLLHRYGESRLGRPGYHPSMSRLGLVDDQIVAHALVEPYLLRYGSAFLRVAGIGRVCTAPGFRHRGYSAALMRDALAFMAEQGVHLALLQSILSDYYTHFGFSAVWPYYYFEVDSAEAARLQPALGLRDCAPQDVPQMAALYERQWGARVALLRSPELWQWRAADPTAYLQVVEDSAGQVCGYITGHDLGGDKVEALADNRDATVALLAHCGRIYQRAGEAQIRWLMPPDDPFINYARQVISVRLSAEYPLTGGWMARLIDTGGLIDALLPEIMAQARVVMPGLKARDLVFNCHPDVVEIGLRGQRASMSLLNHQEFIQVMFGSLRPADFGARHQLHPDAVRLLEALFPPRIAALAPWDWF